MFISALSLYVFSASLYVTDLYQKASTLGASTLYRKASTRGLKHVDYCTSPALRVYALNDTLEKGYNASLGPKLTGSSRVENENPQ